MANKCKPLFTKEERKLLQQNERDQAELYQTEEEYMRWLPRGARPDHPEERAQYDDLSEMYPDWGKALKGPRKEPGDVTPEQKAKVDKALADESIGKSIGGASEVTGKPVPNDPTPIENAKTIGQDLQKSGVTMDKDKE